MQQGDCSRSEVRRPNWPKCRRSLHSVGEMASKSDSFNRICEASEREGSEADDDQNSDHSSTGDDVNIDHDDDSCDVSTDSFDHSYQKHEKLDKDTTEVFSKESINESVGSNKSIRPTIKSDSSENWTMSPNSMLLIALIVAIGIVAGSLKTSQETDNVSIEVLKGKFPTQDEFLWLAFESGVKDVVTFNRPSTFILLYQEEAENTVANLVEQLTKYAACIITSCLKQPIVLNNTVLSSSEVITDYGILINQYKDELEDRGVMVIENLQEVPGTSAQAFHSFCDEFTPLIHKSLFIFTMKVKEMPINKMKYVEDYFKNKWTDIKIDTRSALLTRISSMVIGIES